MSAPAPLTTCRLCGSDALLQRLDLGIVASPGVFPWPGETVSNGPLRLMECQTCRLAQLGDTWDLGELYGPSYGYRSGLNPSMAQHLQSLVERITALVALRPGDRVLDIGSNDGTLLAAYDSALRLRLVGVDPLAAQLAAYYPPGTSLHSAFFSVEQIRPDGPFKVVTSVAMFYDLDDPVRFARDVASLLAPGGVWLLEVADWPWLAASGAFDTVCPEHLEYYGLGNLLDIAARVGLRVVECDTSATNGGSLRLVLARDRGAEPLRYEYQATRDRVDWKRLDDLVWSSADALRGFLIAERDAGRSVRGYGASTKGNVLLQVAEITPELLPAIGEVNAEKVGRVTPGTCISIVSEARARAEADTLVVLPWHFREFIASKERAFLDRGGRLFFPLPQPELVTRKGTQRLGAQPPHRDNRAAAL